MSRYWNNGICVTFLETSRNSIHPSLYSGSAHPTPHLEPKQYLHGINSIFTSVPRLSSHFLQSLMKKMQTGLQEFLGEHHGSQKRMKDNYSHQIARRQEENQNLSVKMERNQYATLRKNESGQRPILEHHNYYRKCHVLI